MAVSVSGTVNLEVLLNAVEGLDLGIEKKAAVSQALVQAFSSGVGLGQIDRLWADQRTVSGSATDSLDFAGGGLIDILGNAWAPARLKLLVIKNLGPNDIQVQRPASNGIPLFLAASDGVQIPIGGMVMLLWPSAAGIVVTAGTGDLLNIVNTAAGNIDYVIIAGGASA